MYAREERRDKQHREQHADPRTKGEGPPQRVDEQPQIAGVADDPIDSRRDERMSGLDGDQSTEPAAEHKDGPDPQCTTGGEEHDAKPANGLLVDGPEFLPVRSSTSRTRRASGMRAS